MVQLKRGGFVTKQSFGIIIGGIFLMVIAMGISRFAFTPVLPFMRQDLGLTFEAGSYLASSNYIGYFIGALAAGFMYKKRKNVLIWSVLFNVFSVLLMGFVDAFSVWLLLRFVAGVTGGLMFVLTSSIVMDYLAQRQLSKWAGYLFSGIGLGIAISGLAVPFFVEQFDWQRAWIGLAIISAVLSITIAILWRQLDIPPLSRVPKTTDTTLMKGFMPWLIAAYGLEGLGYIITGTFLVDIVHHIPSLTQYAGYSWVIVGVAVVPSAPIWTMLIEKYAAVTLLVGAYVLQIIGILLPVWSQTVPSVLISAFLYGLTFVGIVTLTTSYARQQYPQQSGVVVSVLTTFYALGQIIGPLIAGQLVARYDNQLIALSFAGVVVIVALMTMLIGKWITRRTAST